MDRVTFTELITRYREGKASPAEISLLEAYYRELANTGSYFLSDEETELLQTLSYGEIARGIQAFNIRRGSRRAWPYWLAAAATIAAVFLLMNLREFREDRQELVQAGLEVTDVAPGREGAILTLADGTVIELDSLNNGHITAQGPAEIIKTGDRIVYNAAPAPPSAEPAYNTISTPYGRQCSIVLPDGTRVALNAGSSLTFPTVFYGDERLVRLSGEAFLEVEKDPKKPFIVQAGQARIRVIGTSFNVQAYADEPESVTTLVDGGLVVEATGNVQNLQPGQQAVMNREGLRLVTNPDLEKVLAWRENTFLFDHDNLRNIMRQIARWYDVEIVYEGVFPDNKLYSGIISRNRKLSAVLSLLSTAENISFDINGNKVFVKSVEPGAK